MKKQYLIEPNADILPAKEDQIFKSLLTRSEPESKIVLMDLIGSVIGRKVTDVVIKNNEPATMDITQKQERLDINCEIDGNEIVNIEMQASYIEEFEKTNHKNLKNKSAYYGCDLFSSQSIKGKTYADLVKTYQITFVAYPIYPRIKDYKNEFQLRTINGEILTEELSIIFVELSKLKKFMKKPIDEMTSLEMWSIFIDCAHEPKYRSVVNKIIEAKEEIQMASTLLQSISQDDYERARFLSRRKFENDLESNMNTAIKKAEKKAHKEKLEIAIKLIKRGIDIQDVSEDTGLNISDIEKETKNSNKKDI